MTFTLRSRLAHRLPVPPPTEDLEPSGTWARRLALRPARVAFLDEAEKGLDGKDPDLVGERMPVAGLHTWRGRVLGAPNGDRLPVRVAEIPSGRTVESELPLQLFRGFDSTSPGTGLVYRWWSRWNGERWERRERVEEFR